MKALTDSLLRGLSWRSESAVLPSGVGRFHRVFDQLFLDVLTLRTFEGPQIGMGGTMFDPSQHHAAAVTFGTAWPLDRK
jgi:hypothetical protein